MNQPENEKLFDARFLSAITHDLAQPLHAARLFASALEGKIPDNKQQQMVDNIHSSLEAAEKMLHEISLFGKVEAGKIPILIEKVSIQQVIAEVVSQYSQLAIEQGVELKFIATKVVVQADKVMLVRALQRLVSNALRFTQNGKVVIGVRRKTCYCSLEIWDNGKGIAEEDLVSIFDEFVRLQNHDLYNERCFGLGLAIVRRICAQIGCEVGVRSWLGKGSVFSLQLPYCSLLS